MTPSRRPISFVLGAVVLCFALLVADVTARRRPTWRELGSYTFEEFVRDFRRPYRRGTKEWWMRSAIFASRMDRIRRHNANESKTWKRGVNAFTDMSDDERRARSGGYRAAAPASVPRPLEVFQVPEKFKNVPLPRSVDYRTWTEPRVLDTVRNQGTCAACWAIAAAETVSAYYALATGSLPRFSIQQLLSCTPSADGCSGGDVTSAWAYLSGTALLEDDAYPFVDMFFNYSAPNATTSACYDATKEFPPVAPRMFAEIATATVVGYGEVPPNNATALMEALAYMGPIAITVASGDWYDYESGVFFNEPSDGAALEWTLDHSVICVGYGVDETTGLPVFIVKNSFGTLFGEGGYIKLLRPHTEPCSPPEYGPICGTSGCLSHPRYPIVKPGPAVNY